jgi:acyl-CoA reductase-like NAD-dependent aldehyde dehydrogenase
MQTTISPHDQSAVCTRPLVSEEQLDVVISDAVKAQKSWKRVSIDERIQIAEKWMVSEA